MVCENLSFKRTLTDFDIEGEDYSPCKSNSNCPKSPRHHPLGRRLCTSGCQPLSKNDKDMKMKTTTIKSKAVNSDVKTNSWFKF